MSIDDDSIFKDHVGEENFLFLEEEKVFLGDQLEIAVLDCSPLFPHQRTESVIKFVVPVTIKVFPKDVHLLNDFWFLLSDAIFAN